MLSIRVLKDDELSELFKYSNDSNLDIEELHLRCQHKIHPKDFFIAHLDDAIVGFIVALRQSEEFGFISCLLVLKEFRGNGYATEILKFALKHLGERQVALDSVLDKSSMYENLGFKSYFDLHTFLYITKKPSAPNSQIKFVNYKDSNILNPYLKCLLSSIDTNFKAIKKDSINTSYGLSFKHKDGYKVVIDTKEYIDAKEIFIELTRGLDEDISIYLEATKLNPIFLNLADELGMIECSRFSRMYNKVL